MEEGSGGESRAAGRLRAVRRRWIPSSSTVTEAVNGIPSAQIRRRSQVRMPQDMSRALVITAERLARMTVLLTREDRHQHRVEPPAFRRHVCFPRSSQPCRVGLTAAGGFGSIAHEASRDRVTRRVPAPVVISTDKPTLQGFMVEGLGGKRFRYAGLVKPDGLPSGAWRRT